MTEAEWLTCADPELMLNAAETRGLRKRRLFAVACCRRIANLLTSDALKAVNAAEKFADGHMSESQLARVRLGIGYPRAQRRQYAADAARAASAPVGSNAAAGAALGVLYAVPTSRSDKRYDDQRQAERVAQVALVREIFGNPFRPLDFALWRTETAVTLAHQMYESCDFGAMAILADALQDAGCDSDEVLRHCREGEAHVRGCWVIDAVLGKS